MKIIDLLRSGKVGISSEMFPPKKESGLPNSLEIVHEIAKTNTDFISVTYGAGGSLQGQALAIACEIQKCGIPAMSHLTCINSDEEKIEAELERFKAAGIENVLALRGDRVPGGVDNPKFLHASDLTRKIKSFGDFCVGGACYPHGHPEASSLDEDIEHTKFKIDAGCDFLVTQMIFDNDVLYNYMFRLMAHGINVPVIPGIMPVVNAKQITRICELSGMPLPTKFRAIVEKYADNPAALMQAGIAYSEGQIVDLIANGFKNIHIYTMNKPEIIGAVCKNLSELLK